MSVDALLVKCERAPPAFDVVVAEAMSTANLPAATVSVHRALERTMIYAYIVPSRPPADRHVAQTFAKALRALPGGTTAPEVLALQAIADLPGASAGASAPFHYVVEAGVDAEHEPEFNAWYDTEHLPGLAAVPGCVRARRFRVAGDERLYVACYDLTAPSALTSDAWLAVRRTPWSERVRPTFRDTKRTMFETLEPGSNSLA